MYSKVNNFKFVNLICNGKLREISTHQVEQNDHYRGNSFLLGIFNDCSAESCEITVKFFYNLIAN